MPKINQLVSVDRSLLEKSKFQNLLLPRKDITPEEKVQFYELQEELRNLES